LVRELNVDLVIQHHVNAGCMRCLGHDSDWLKLADRSVREQRHALETELLCVMPDLP
jgi:hypothetical protein